MSSPNSLIEVAPGIERARDPEADRIQRFMGSLAQISGVREIIPDTKFEDDEPIFYAEKRFLAYSYDNTPTMYINPKLVSIQPDDFEGKVSFIPSTSRGGKRSGHGVFFGFLQVGQAEIPVAVKPHIMDSPTKVLDDYFNTHALEELGIYSLTPAGLLMMGEADDIAYSMTILEEDLTTLDSIDWSNYYPNINKNPGMQEMWREISGQTAFLHADGNKRHGDLAARNIATCSEGSAFLIDWEYAHLSEQAPRDAESRFAHSFADLKVLLESMCLPPHADIGGRAGIGIFYGKEGNWWEGFCEVFYDEYTHVRRVLAQQGNHHAQTVLQVEEELVELTRSLKAEMEIYEAICKTIPPRNEHLCVYV